MPFVFSPREIISPPLANAAFRAMTTKIVNDPIRKLHQLRGDSPRPNRTVALNLLLSAARYVC